MRRNKRGTLTSERCRQLFLYDNGSLLDIGTGLKRGGHSIPADGKYSLCSVDGFQVAQHLIVWLLFNDVLPEVVEHSNEIKTDNRIENLRAADKQRNEANTGPRKTNRTGFKGIRCHKPGRYTAQMNIGKSQVYLSIESSSEDAATVYNFAVYEWAHPFAQYNTVPQPWLDETK